MGFSECLDTTEWSKKKEKVKKKGEVSCQGSLLFGLPLRYKNVIILSFMPRLREPPLMCSGPMLDLNTADYNRDSCFE